MKNIHLDMSELGKKTPYDTSYNPQKLYPIPRKMKRNEIGISAALPFYGEDIWNHYEVSWLNLKGKPMAAVAQISYDCESENIIESKSMKLYFNSFNNTKFKDHESVEQIISQDISERIASKVDVKITPLNQIKNCQFTLALDGICIDELDIECNVYKCDPNFLVTENDYVSETLCTDLLKSNCLVTNQPDWCSLQIAYEGNKINHEGLLRYIVSFRNENEFHEQCIEKIFMHIMQACKPKYLTVYGRSTRRGGIDINSFRSTEPNYLEIENQRLFRQ